MELVAPNMFSLPPNAKALGNARWHYTPLWFPNGNYTVQARLFDLWTPAGMLDLYTNDTVTIRDSAYDDWYVGQ